MKLLAFLVVLFPLSAAAQAVWDVTPGTEKGTCDFYRGIDVCFADFDTDESSLMLDTRLCENYTARWISNIASTAHDNDITIRWSISPIVSVNTSEIVNNKTLTGDPATDSDVLAGYDTPWLYADITAYVTGTGRLAIQCWKRAN